MEIGQRLGIVEPRGLGHEALEQRQHAVGPVDEAGKGPTPIRPVAGSVLIEPRFGARRILGRRQEQ